MGDRVIDLVGDMLREKDYGYFMSHGLAELLGRAGLENSRDNMRAVVRLLIDDGQRRFLTPISAGLRDTAGDDDEFARMAADMAGQARHDAFCGPLAKALVDIGKGMPAAAVGIAARMIRLGCADFGAFLLGGAYEGARTECDEVIERLLLSEDPADVASAVRSLRVASAEHGCPDAGRIRDAVEEATGHAKVLKSELLQEESMAAMLDAYKGDARTGRMIESMAARFRASRPVLAGRIFADSPFDDMRSLRHLDACVMVNDPSWDSVRCAHLALAGIARRDPRGATRLLFTMLSAGRYDDARAGPVLEELGRSDAGPAADAVLEMLYDRRRCVLGWRLGEIMRRLLRFADCEEVAARVFRTLDGRPDALGACLPVLYLLVIENDRDDRDPRFAASVMSRLLERVAGAGASAPAARGRGSAADAGPPSAPAAQGPAADRGSYKGGDRLPHEAGSRGRAR